MKLTESQLTRMIEQRVNTKILEANQTGDRISEEEWKLLKVKSEKRQLYSRVTEEFIIDFTKWLMGKTVYNSETYEELFYGDDGTIRARQVVPGCPWGSIS